MQQADTDAFRVHAFVPAHNEAEHIVATLRSLQQQTRPPERIVVVADNCTDETAELALAQGAAVFVTQDNTHKKAGALNQAITQEAATFEWAEQDLVLAMDADSTLHPRWIEVATRAFDDRQDIGAVGGIFYGDDRPGLLAQMQRNEYARYAREIAVKKGKVSVLTGTATMFRWPALQAVSEHRPSGEFYDTRALTEDNEITLALKSLGFRMISPRSCRVYTETMPTWRDLWHQRLRWQRGALENLGAYGLTRVTLPYVGQQAGMAAGVILFTLYLVVLVSGLLIFGLHWSPIWVGIGAIFLAERLVTVWTAGWRARLVALPLVLEMAFDAFLMAVLIRSAWDIALRRQATWHHVTEPAPAGLSR
ncbi:MAG: glycosyltransferase family 2 protein [Micrococcales bacterium]|nr:glycosyltransferase family 2 protein [Micrococcales bacterium]